ncbi:hypothetical protein MOO46_06060 [Apilactobacillus apisilvae]|uniref:WxL domain-containing protein n=1 Tax=Apilactobacillus apisilvae TaxID=2923364 RepID=A0ABY4PH28_9LACO|nr:hypothetical protein [Apilactobacillus apisilvae]UQS84808.1 hypothetical protein MOO46_06060 [Apilactobacillus apisilvae]
MNLNKIITLSAFSLCSLGLAMIGVSAHADSSVANNNPNSSVDNNVTTGPLTLNHINGLKASDLNLNSNNGNINAPMALSDSSVTANFNNFTGTDNFNKWSLSLSGSQLTNQANKKTTNATIDLGNGKTVNLDSKSSTDVFNNTGVAEGSDKNLTISNNPKIIINDKSLPQDPNTTNSYSTTLNWNLSAGTPLSNGK